MQYSELYICTYHIKDVVHEWNKGPFLLFSIPSEKKKNKNRKKRKKEFHKNAFMVCSKVVMKTGLKRLVASFTTIIL